MQLLGVTMIYVRYAAYHSETRPLAAPTRAIETDEEFSWQTDPIAGARKRR